MCSPVAVIGLSAAAGVYSAYNQYQQGNSEGQYYNYLSNQSAQQGQLALERGKQQAKVIQDLASHQIKDLKTAGAQMSASQRAALAANGIDASSVTAQDIATDTLSKQDMDELAIRYNANTRAWEAQTDANYQDYAARAEADQYRYASRNARRAGKTNAFSTLLGTAATTAYQYNFLKRK